MAVVELGYSPKKQGAVPFKWEVIPGVPKQQLQYHVHDQQLPPLRFRKYHQPSSLEPPASPPTLLSPSTSFINRRSSSSSPRSLSLLAPPHLQQQQQQKQLIIKLKPPPALLAKSYPPSESRGNSFRSNPRSRSERWKSHNSTGRIRPDIVSTGCLIGSWFRRKKTVTVSRPESEPGCNSDLDVVGRWSVSSMKSLSPFRSPMSSNSSSSYLSPRPGSEPDWAGFGLF